MGAGVKKAEQKAFEGASLWGVDGLRTAGSVQVEAEAAYGDKVTADGVMIITPGIDLSPGVMCWEGIGDLREDIIILHTAVVAAAARRRTQEGEIKNSRRLRFVFAETAFVIEPPAAESKHSGR